MAYVVKINGYDIKDAEARADLADEITARQSADTALGGRIDDETSARQSADTALGGRIDDEITARQSADTALGGKIGDLSELTTTATADLVAAINEVDSHADTNAANIAVIIGNDTGKSMREVAQEVSATVYTPQGSCTFANLPNLSAESTRVGFVYDVTDAFTTTSDFKEGAGIEVPAGTNVVVADVSGTKMWDLLGFNIDLSSYQKKVMTSSVTVGGVSQTTVEGAIGALAELPVDTVADGNMNPVTSNAVYDTLKDRLNGMNMTITTSNGTNFSTRIRLKSPNYVSIYIIGDQGIYIIGIDADTSALTVNTLLGSNPPVSPTLTSNSDGSYQLVYTYATGVHTRQLIIS